MGVLKKKNNNYFFGGEKTNKWPPIPRVFFAQKSDWMHEIFRNGPKTYDSISPERNIEIQKYILRHQRDNKFIPESNYRSLNYILPIETGYFAQDYFNQFTTDFFQSFEIAISKYYQNSCILFEEDAQLMPVPDVNQQKSMGICYGGMRKIKNYATCDYISCLVCRSDNAKDLQNVIFNCGLFLRQADLQHIAKHTCFKKQKCHPTNFNSFLSHVMNKYTWSKFMFFFMNRQLLIWNNMLDHLQKLLKLNNDDYFHITNNPLIYEQEKNGAKLFFPILFVHKKIDTLNRFITLHEIEICNSQKELKTFGTIKSIFNNVAIFKFPQCSDIKIEFQQTDFDFFIQNHPHVSDTVIFYFKHKKKSFEFTLTFAATSYNNFVKTLLLTIEKYQKIAIRSILNNNRKNKCCNEITTIIQDYVIVDAWEHVNEIVTTISGFVQKVQRILSTVQRNPVNISGFVEYEMIQYTTSNIGFKQTKRKRE